MQHIFGRREYFDVIVKYVLIRYVTWTIQLTLLISIFIVYFVLSYSLEH
jgi:hypothetical protein